MDGEAESVTVEPSTAKPKTTRQPRASKKGVIQPHHVEQWTTQVFALVAMVKNAPYWAVANPEIEVRPWAAPAAELLNKIPARYAEQAIVANAAVAVVAGIGMMVYQRSMIDMLQKQARVTPAGAGADFENAQRERSAHSQPTSSGGATPVSPREPIFGNADGII
ncbi:MAG: hypothetical protein ACR2OE_01095 [Thermomicrobiales bacterium]